jgi:aminoglycoside phosphotransferase (APT) family kinase protein
MELDEPVDRWLSNRGLPGPGYFVHDLSRSRVGFDFEVMKVAPGIAFKEFDNNEQSTLEYLKVLGSILAKVHNIEVEGYGPIVSFDEPISAIDNRYRGIHNNWRDYIFTRLENHIEFLESNNSLSKSDGWQVCRAFADHRELFDIRSGSLLHGDPGSHNVFVDENKITALIDWEDSLSGDPVYEIAFWATFHPERRHAAFLEGYRQEAELPKDFEARFWIYFLRVALFKTIVRHRLGIQDKPGRPPAAKRITDALEKLQALA